MDPPDVMGMEPGTARPTKLPNRTKSKFVIVLNIIYSGTRRYQFSKLRVRNDFPCNNIKLLLNYYFML